MREFETKEIELRSDQITVDTTYQRKIIPSEVKNIVKEFNPNVVNAPKLSFRDGRYYVFDGQHTIAALEARNGGKPLTIKCKVFFGMTQLDEAELFKLQTGFSRKTNAIDNLRADYNMGNQEVKRMVKAIETAGLEMCFTHTQTQNKINCAAAIWKSYNMLDLEQFVGMLAMIKSAWNGQPDSLSGQIISGMTRFYKAYYGEFNSKNLAEKLSKACEPVAIIREAKGIGGGANTIARIVLRIYNSGKTSGKLPDKL